MLLIRSFRHYWTIHATYQRREAVWESKSRFSLVSWVDCPDSLKRAAIPITSGERWESDPKWFFKPTVVHLVHKEPNRYLNQLPAAPSGVCIESTPNLFLQATCSLIFLHTEHLFCILVSGICSSFAVYMTRVKFIFKVRKAHPVKNRVNEYGITIHIFWIHVQFKNKSPKRVFTCVVTDMRSVTEALAHLDSTSCNSTLGNLYNDRFYSLHTFHKYFYNRSVNTLNTSIFFFKVQSRAK